ncbi:hypothetical protein E4T44_12151 [Aureobasidium sp. EXF-8845]|jgi:hypothetical protein|nr:hypothetical protein E4T45_12661 [Aureobasidium sp. EXF-8846]KAI4796998.1 hypothetical protein E4T44_12151 [Aureobasidium sp. EXF-8845]
MLASSQAKAATMRTASSTSGNIQKSSSGTVVSTWSRNTRYTLRIPLIGRQIHVSSRRACRQVESVLYVPSTLYRGFYELEREVCSAIFGALYEQGEKTSFAMSVEMELLYHVQDGQSGYLSPKRERFVIDENNWEEGMDLILSGEAKKTELRATWHRSKGSAQLSKSMSTTPSNFPLRKDMEQMSTGVRSPMRTSSSSPRRSETMSIRRSSGSERDNSPVSRTDSGLGEMVEVLK